MENTIYSLEALFKTSVFQIPPYQRAYAWEDVHVKAFLEDLSQQVEAQKKNPQKKYFLGTLLLHEVEEKGQRYLHVVDGQQRLTTAITFLATALHQVDSGNVQFVTEKPNVIKRDMIYDRDDECQKFYTIEEDEPFFRTHILRIHEGTVVEVSPSSVRLKKAAQYFRENVNDDQWEPLVTALKNAQVMVYSVSNNADATQIFELQNDRGKRLSDLESLKSYLMHCIYLHSQNPENHLKAIHTLFSKIFRMIESLGAIDRTPNEDSILAYHCTAHLPWASDSWRNPKQLIKDLIRDKGEDVVDWINKFVSELAETYRSVKELFDNRSCYPEFAEIIVLGRIAPFWPLLLKTFSMDNTEDKANFRKTCRLMEVYAFKGYAICNLRSDGGMTRLYNEARDFEGDFTKLHDLLTSMCSWYNQDARFASGLNNPKLYLEDRSDALYLLWKYENHLRERRGIRQPLLSWQDYISPRGLASKLCIGHVAAQGNPIAKTDVEWDEGVVALFEEVATHRLGNLVIDSICSNASKGKEDFTGKLRKLSVESTYLSQGELIQFAETVDGEPVWTMDSVKKRHAALVEFCNAHWDPTSYHQPTQTAPEAAAAEEDKKPVDTNVK